MFSVSFISFTVFNILVHVGVVLTYPILISIGTLLSVPGNAGKVFQSTHHPLLVILVLTDLNEVS